MAKPLNIVFVLAVGLSGFLAIAVLGNVFAFFESDSAGQGMARGFALVADLALWLSIGFLWLLAVIHGGFLGPFGALALVFICAGAVGSVACLRALDKLHAPDRHTMLLQAGVIAPAVFSILICIWGYLTRRIH